MMKVYKRKKSTPDDPGDVGIHIPNTPAKKRQRYSGSSTLYASSTGSLEAKLDSCSRLTIELPICETNETAELFDREAGEDLDMEESFANGFRAALLLEPGNMFEDDEEGLTQINISSTSSSQGFGSIETSFKPVAQPDHDASQSMSQYNLTSQELVDGGNFESVIGSLGRKPWVESTRTSTPKKKVKKKKVRGKVIPNLGRPMEPKTPVKKKKAKTPKKKTKSMKKSSSKRKPSVSRWKPNLQIYRKKKRMWRKRRNTSVWQVLAEKFGERPLKLRRLIKTRGVTRSQRKILHAILRAEKQFLSCFISQKEEHETDEKLSGLIPSLESDSIMVLDHRLSDRLQDDISEAVQKPRNNHANKNDKSGSHTEDGIEPNGSDELAIVVMEKGKGIKEKIFDKLEHKELVKPWKLELRTAVEEGNKQHHEDDPFWQREREIFFKRINSFLTCTRAIQGNRKFSEWGGSVVDSIVGVFLTQNVSDHLSSSAFISLTAAFPDTILKSSSEKSLIVKIEELEECETSASNREQSNGSQESVGRNEVSDESLSTEEEATTEMECLAVDVSCMPLATQGDEDCHVETPSEKCEPSEDIVINFSQTFFNADKQKAKKWKRGTQECQGNEVVSMKSQWDYYRRKYSGNPRKISHMDAIDWEAVNQAGNDDTAEAIKLRGQHNNIARQVKKFLNQVKQDQNELNLEWLRWAPAEIVRSYLTSIDGIGLKSVECVRLLALKQIAFPVDVNVGRIAIRLGWVPMQPLPEGVQIHLLDQMPIMDDVQQYLWPRLCHMKFEELYELHYQMITFGKVFCTKRKPSCHSCPMKDDCKYYHSAYGSAKLAALPESKESGDPLNSGYKILDSISRLSPENNTESEYQLKDCEPIIEEPATSPELLERDIEDLFSEKQHSNTIESSRNDVTALVVSSVPEEASPNFIHMLKIRNRLSTRHSVYIIKDEHPLFKVLQLERRHPDDKHHYLFAMCTPDHTSICEAPNERSNSQESPCDGGTQYDTVQGTILIPCRTAMKGMFPLNGTYFQVNEVFADYESSINPINVGRELLKNLTITYAYFGSSTTSILKGLQTYEIAQCFSKGHICVRAFNRETRLPKPLLDRFHFSGQKGIKVKSKTMKKKLDD